MEIDNYSLFPTMVLLGIFESDRKILLAHTSFNTSGYAFFLEIWFLLGSMTPLPLLVLSSGTLTFWPLLLNFLFLGLESKVLFVCLCLFFLGFHPLSTVLFCSHFTHLLWAISCRPILSIRYVPVTPKTITLTHDSVSWGWDSKTATLNILHVPPTGCTQTGLIFPKTSFSSILYLSSIHHCPPTFPSFHSLLYFPQTINNQIL